MGGYQRRKQRLLLPLLRATSQDESPSQTTTATTRAMMTARPRPTGSERTRIEAERDAADTLMMPGTVSLSEWGYMINPMKAAASNARNESSGATPLAPCDHRLKVAGARMFLEKNQKCETTPETKSENMIEPHNQAQKAFIASSIVISVCLPSHERGPLTGHGAPHLRCGLRICGRLHDTRPAPSHQAPARLLRRPGHERRFLDCQASGAGGPTGLRVRLVIPPRLR